MKYIVTLIIYLSCLSSLWAQITYEGEITIKGGNTIELEEGAIFDGVIRLWKKDANWQSALKKLEGQKLGKNFYTYSIGEVKPSPNNEEVAEAYGKFILIEAFKPQSKISFKNENDSYVLEIRKINAIATSPAGQEFTYVEQPDLVRKLKSLSFWIWPLVVVGFLFFAVIVFPKIKRKRALTRQRQYWLNTIKQAQSRESIENIGKNIEQIGNLLNISSEKISKFKIQLNEIQYQKEWTVEQKSKLEADMKDMIDG